MSNKTLTLGQAAAWCGGQIAPALEERPFLGAKFSSRLIRPGELFAALPGARDGHDFAASALERGAAAVLASRPVDGPAIYVEDTSRALRDIARGYRESLPCRCVGITGSVGKTTTKEMIAAVLRTALRTQWTEKNYNNEIGLPVSVLRLKPDCEAAVLEMGMNHFGELSVLTRIAQPDLAVITSKISARARASSAPSSRSSRVCVPADALFSMGTTPCCGRWPRGIMPCASACLRAATCAPPACANRQREANLRSTPSERALRPH